MLCLESGKSPFDRRPEIEAESRSVVATEEFDLDLGPVVVSLGFLWTWGALGAVRG